MVDAMAPQGGRASGSSSGTGGDPPHQVVVEMASPTAAIAPNATWTAKNLKAGASNVGRGMRITFKDLGYIVKNSANKKEELSLLKGVSGFMNPAQMCALMGPSGSGKTTLLDVLAGRKTVGRQEGEVLFAGAKPSKGFLRRYTGYVEQFDTLLPTLTVSEMLMYTAELKRPLKESTAEKRAAVEEVIKELALVECRDTLIGSALARGISGGQAKRANIGISLITQPRVLFLDEPTSGLDSYTSNEVMRYVKELVKDGITICATIHSPTAYTFSLFDCLLMLLRGRVVYFGENGDSAMQYFRSSAPVVEGVPEVNNEAEWIVELTTKGDRLGMADDFANAYDNSDIKAANVAELDDLSCSGCSMNKAVLDKLKGVKGTVTPSWWALWILFRYRTLKDYRNPDFLGPRIADKIIFSIVIFTVYWGLGDTTNPGQYVTVAAIFFMWTTLPAFGAAAYTPALVLERPLFIRERNDGLYRVMTYLCFKIFSELLLATIVTSITATWAWFALDLRGLWVIFWLAQLTTLSVGILLAYLIAAVSPNMDVANAALPTYVVTLLFFGGFLIRWDDIPKYWIWYAYINPLRYAWGALMKNQFGDCCNEIFLDNMTVLEYYGLTGINPWVFLAIESAFIVVFFFLAWCALAFVKHSKR